ncbi:FAD-binding domain-containing protein [Gloeopeniophorella convolvens]|nr:FAD-binding domain-containing protein [Gloeopeniophorella convolvens]
MISATFLFCALALFSLAPSEAKTVNTRGPSEFESTCNAIAAAVSNSSQVFFPGSPQYASDNHHMYISSSAASACSVEPGSVKDVSTILGILGSTRTPFAVKGGGHATNPGFSSTNGVEVAMARFNDISVNATAGTVDVGPGLVWDDVYKALNSTGFNVVGGRVPTVGVAGVALGGGYSFMSNQYGLAIDNIEAFELVFPNGTTTSVTSENADLWFALRGGFNNFGIVTKFTLNLHPQGEIWGGVVRYAPDQLAVFKAAVVKYQQNKDIKAAVAASLSYTPEGVVPGAILFYDGSTPPPGVFDEFLAIPTNQSDVSTRPFVNFFSTLSFLNVPPSTRGFYSGIPVTQYSPVVLNSLANQTQFWGNKWSALDESLSFTVVIEPFESGIFSHGSGSAYPPDRSHAVLPTGLNLGYTNASLDGFMAKSLREFTDTVQAAAVADGQNVSDAAPYVNYALFDTPLETMYGAGLPRLHSIKKSVDPDNVMGLAGGWKF